MTFFVNNKEGGGTITALAICRLAAIAVVGRPAFSTRLYLAASAWEAGSNKAGGGPLCNECFRHHCKAQYYPIQPRTGNLP